MQLLKKLGLFGFLLLLSSCVTEIETGKPSIQPTARPKDNVRMSEQDAIESLVRQKISDLDVCYQAEKAQNPGAKGRILIAFTIERSGAVSDPRIEYSSFQSPVMEGCVLGRIEQWIFTEAHNLQTLKVRYPFAFGMR